MTKGQRAAKAVKAMGPFDTCRSIARDIGTSHEPVRRARFVRDYAPHLIDRIIAGHITLDYAYKRVSGQKPIHAGPLPEVAKLNAKRFVSPFGCWEWTGETNGYGYGRVSIRGRTYYTHRLAYQLVLGEPIPDGYVVDHLCENPICFNPEHLEAVTHQENIRRASKVGGKTHCLHGHAYTPNNTYVTPAGSRQCRTCKQRRARVTNTRRRQEIRK